MPLPASEPSPLSALRAAELAANPEAEYWAAACGWVPGTGHCRNRDCGSECLFQAQCETEARQVVRQRRRRRAAQQSFVQRGGRR